MLSGLKFGRWGNVPYRKQFENYFWQRQPSYARFSLWVDPRQNSRAWLLIAMCHQWYAAQLWHQSHQHSPLIGGSHWSWSPSMGPFGFELVEFGFELVFLLFVWTGLISPCFEQETTPATKKMELVWNGKMPQKWPCWRHSETWCDHQAFCQPLQSQSHQWRHSGKKPSGLTCLCHSWCPSLPGWASNTRENHML